MATLLGSLLVSLGLESAQFRKGMSDAERSMVQVQKRFEKVGTKMANVGKTMSLAVTGPLLAFGTLSAKTASDAAELQSAFDQTFGSMSNAMNAWAETTGDALGRSTQEMQRAANTFGIFFNQAAPTAQAAADMSKEFAVLAQDLASFYNVDVQTAVDKLRSGLTGEAEPLRDFGVFLDAAVVNAKALELGLAKTTKEITEQDKIMARYSVILEATSNAQGDVARTADSTANQMRAAQAAFEELQVAIGTKLLPVVTPLITKLAGVLDYFANLPGPVQDVVVGVAAFSAAVGPVVYIIGNLTSGFGLLLPLLTKVPALFTAIKVAGLALMANPVILAFAAVLAGIYLAWQNWDKIKPIIDRLVAMVTAFWNVHVKPIFDAVKETVLGAVTWWLDMQIGTIRVIAAMVNKIREWLVGKLGEIFLSIKRRVDQVKGFFLDMYKAVVGNSYVPDMVNGIAREMARLGKVMVDPAEKATKSVQRAAREMASEVQSLLARLFPEIERARQMLADKSLIQRSGLSDRDKQEAIFRLVGGRARQATSFDNDNGPLVEADRVREAAARISQSLSDQADGARTQTVRIAESFRDMARSSIDAMQNMVDAIQGGGFLDILGGALDLFLQLGSTGLLGGGLARSINRASIPGYANGTRNHPGGLAIVGERGPELVSMPRGSSVMTNRELRAANQNGRIELFVHPSGEFDARVSGVSARVVNQAAPAIASAGGAVAERRISKRQRRRVA